MSNETNKPTEARELSEIVEWMQDKVFIKTHKNISPDEINVEKGVYIIAQKAEIERLKAELVYAREDMIRIKYDNYQYRKTISELYDIIYQSKKQKP